MGISAVMLAMKIATLGGVSLATITGIKFFHTYNPTFSKRKGGGSDDSGELSAFKERVRSAR